MPRGEAKAEKPAHTRSDSKVGQLIERAKSPDGLTYRDIRVATGWTKFGGFFTAAKKAGLVLHQCRERIDGERDTRFFAVPGADVQAGRMFAYRQAPDGRWVPCGDYANEDEAVRCAQAEAPEGVTITASRGKPGELYLRAAAEEQARRSTGTRGRLVRPSSNRAAHERPVNGNLMLRSAGDAQNPVG